VFDGVYNKNNPENSQHSDLEKQLRLDEIEAQQAAAEIPDPPNIINAETPDEPMLSEKSSVNPDISQLTLD